MADLINLRQAKKARARAKARAAGDEKAALFGRTKAEKDQERAATLKARAHLDAHKRQTDKTDGCPPE
ncbi:MAG: DUF4169 family protein [Rhodobacteraceae bacterium]|nr:DUF4169 family protein [Paracoccaceae bacterium]